MDSEVRRETLFLPLQRTPVKGTKRLRVGVALGCDPPAPWVKSLIQMLSGVPGLDVYPSTIGATGQIRRPGRLMERLYGASRMRSDLFGDAIFAEADSIDPARIEALRAAGCDVVVWLARCMDHALPLDSLAKHGVLTVAWGDGDEMFPFWTDVAGNRLTSATAIRWHKRSFAEWRVARSAETSTVPGLFFTMNAEQPVAAAMRMLAGLCFETMRGGMADLAAALPEQTASRTAREAKMPSEIAVAGFVARKLARSAYLRWKTRKKDPRWFVAIRPNGGASIADAPGSALTGFRDVALPDGVREMADPFLWEAGGAHYLLFEEVAAGQKRGRLACAEVLPDGTCGEMRIVLDKPYHLSYPCVVPSGGELFLLPETAEANRVELYRFRKFPYEVEPVAVLLEDVALVDSTPVSIDGRWYLFTTTVEPFMETLLFTAARLDGPWELHPASPVSATVRSCRSAGQLFRRNGRLFRPVQDCSVRYGYGMMVQEVLQLTPTHFKERTAAYIAPDWRRDLLGTHTWNESAAFQTIDGIRYSQ